MFDNIGSKIKDLARLLCCLGIIASVIIGFVCFSGDLFGIGVLIMLGGALFFWVGSFVTYGFGQLIENSDVLVDTAKNLSAVQNPPIPSAKTAGASSVNPAKATSPQTKSLWRCSVCGNMISENPCPYCHKKTESTSSSNRTLCPHCNKKIIIPEDLVNPTCPWCNNEILQ